MMMDKSTAEKFKESYDWCQNLYRDLAGLFRMISGRLAEKPLEYKYESAALPDSSPAPTMARYYTLPDPIIRYHTHRDKPHLSLVSVLSDKWPYRREVPIAGRAAAPLAVLQHELVKPRFLEPSLAIFLHDPFSKQTAIAPTKCIVRECNVVREEGEGEWLKGKLAVRAGGKEVRFFCFAVPLDAFSDDECPNQETLKAVIGDRIINPLKKRLDEFGEAKQ